MRSPLSHCDSLSPNLMIFSRIRQRRRLGRGTRNAMHNPERKNSVRSTKLRFSTAASEIIKQALESASVSLIQGPNIPQTPCSTHSHPSPHYQSMQHALIRRPSSTPKPLHTPEGFNFLKDSHRRVRQTTHSIAHAPDPRIENRDKEPAQQSADVHKTPNPFSWKYVPARSLPTLTRSHRLTSTAENSALNKCSMLAIMHHDFLESPARPIRIPGLHKVRLRILGE